MATRSLINFIEVNGKNKVCLQVSTSIMTAPLIAWVKQSRIFYPANDW